MRRLDFLEVLDRVPMPEIDAGMYLIDALFKVGPVAGENPISEADLDSWERRRGVEFEPWEAEAVVAMSRAYLGEMHAAREANAEPPWPEAVRMWQYVKNAMAEKTWDRLERNLDRNGSRKRHRNPPPG